MYGSKTVHGSKIRLVAPGSSTGLAGVVIFDDEGKQLAYSHHGSDVLGDGKAHDAFDVLRMLECGGDMNQALDKARERLGMPAFKPQTKTSHPPVPHHKKESSSSRANHHPTLVQLSTVEAKDVSWLWHPYIPLGKLTLLEGDPSAGKTFLSLALCASITKGWAFLSQDGSPLGENTEPHNVVYLTAEDGLDDTIKPRFDSMGGDATRFYALTGSTTTNEAGEAQELPVSLADVDVLRDMLEQLQPKLVVIDPVQAYLGAGVDMHRANEVRPLLSGLTKLAEEFQCAFILIRHVGKSTKAKALYSGLGSIDFAAAARSVLLAGEHDGSKVMAHVKSSLTPAGKSMSYSVGGEVGFTWDGVSTLTAEDIRCFEPVAERNDTGSSLEEAKEWLQSQLVEGALPSKALISYARAEGISKATLERAKKKLEVRSYRQSKGNEGEGTWLWYLEGHKEPAAESETFEGVAENSAKPTVEYLANLAKNADRNTTPATYLGSSLEDVAGMPTLLETTASLARYSKTKLREKSLQKSVDDLAGGNDDAVF
jgi:archaellum biogenesis ATPase FlaH